MENLASINGNPGKYTAREIMEMFPLCSYSIGSTDGTGWFFIGGLDEYDEQIHGLSEKGYSNLENELEGRLIRLARFAKCTYKRPKGKGMHIKYKESAENFAKRLKKVAGEFTKAHKKEKTECIEVMEGIIESYKKGTINDSEIISKLKNLAENDLGIVKEHRLNARKLGKIAQEIPRLDKSIDGMIKDRLDWTDFEKRGVVEAFTRITDEEGNFGGKMCIGMLIDGNPYLRGEWFKHELEEI